VRAVPPVLLQLQPATCCRISLPGQNRIFRKRACRRALLRGTFHQVAAMAPDAGGSCSACEGVNGREVRGGRLRSAVVGILVSLDGGAVPTQVHRLR